MALCEAKLESGLESSGGTEPTDITNHCPATPPMNLSVDYRSPRDHFIPDVFSTPPVSLQPPSPLPAPSISLSVPPGLPSEVPRGPQLVEPHRLVPADPPVKRKRGRPRIDKTSPEYLARFTLVPKKKPKEGKYEQHSSTIISERTVKRKRGRPRVDKTSPEYIARKQARELEILEKKAKRQYKRRPTGVNKVIKSTRLRKRKPLMVRKNGRKKDSGASSSTEAPRVKRKYTRRIPKQGLTQSGDPNVVKIPGKRGRKRKIVLGPDGLPIEPPPHRSPVQLSPSLPPSLTSLLPSTKVGLMDKAELLELAAAAALAAGGEFHHPALAQRHFSGVSMSASAGRGGKRGGKRGRPPRDKKALQSQAPYNNLMSPPCLPSPISESDPTIIDSDDDQNLGSPSSRSDSLSLDENLRALRHLHEKYANISRSDDFESKQLLNNIAAKFKQPNTNMNLHVNKSVARKVASPITSENRILPTLKNKVRTDFAGVLNQKVPPAVEKPSEDRIERLEDSSENSGSDSSSSDNSGSSSSSDSSDSESGSGSSSSDSDSDSDSDRSVNGDMAERRKDGAERLTSDINRSIWPRVSQPHDRRSSDSDSSIDSTQPRINETHGDTGADLNTGPQTNGDIGYISESSSESPDKSFQCHICHKWFSTNVTLKIHKRSHNARTGGSSGRRRAPDRYECDCCDATFSRRERLQNHKVEVHRATMVVRCQTCRKCFEDEVELSIHESAHTEDEKAGRCVECGSTFSRFDQLKRHISSVHARERRDPTSSDGDVDGRHACRLCGKAFGHAHSLTRHLANHQKAVYKCVVCKQSFGHADELAQHLNSHLDRYKKLKT